MADIPELGADFKAYQDRLHASLLDVTRGANQLSNYDLSFHRTADPEIDTGLKAQSAHLLRLTNKLLKAVTKDTTVKSPNIENADAVDDNWRKIVDVVDDLLEKADASLDEFSGVIKRLSPARQATPEAPAAKPKPKQNALFVNSHLIPKPQLLFETKVDNFATETWRPLLKTKPHARIPLDESIGDAVNGSVANIGVQSTSADMYRYKHPYAFEIENMEYPQRMFEYALPIPFTRPENSQAVWVDTEEGVAQMLQELKTATEIAVDLEHNDKNSYIGMVSLMQISIRNKDWIVDTLQPWRENLQVLNEVFADPNIIKVFHGSTSDMIWLQRDLGIYVVGLFDTYHACNALSFPGRGLAFLLQKYAHFQAQKQYQLADWRQRPLPNELIDYARSDTHYLLYIYDNLRNELVRGSTPDRNLTKEVIEGSKQEALQVYERPAYDRENGLGHGGWLKILLAKTSSMLDKQQFGVLRALHEWRDQKARELDEGESNIMTNAYMWACVENMPHDFRPLYNSRVYGKPSRYVASHTKEVIDVIKKGVAEGMHGPTVEEVIKRNQDKLSTFRTFRRNNPQAKPQEVNRSLAETMKGLVASGAIQPPPNNAQSSGPTKIVARGTVSAFWGSVPIAATPPVHDMTAMTKALQSVVPLQAALDGDNTPTKEEVPTQTITKSIGATNGTSSSPLTTTDNTFVLRETGRKRPAESSDDEDGEISDDKSPIPTTTDSQLFEDARAAKMAARAAKKAKKEEDKAARAAAQANEQPFDYANAPSVLFPQNGSTTNGTNGAGLPTQKPMNLAAKALDTSTGARRNKFGKELAGKSHTFKS